MPKPFDELRERLLRAGVAPRHVRRYLAELSDHLADLEAEEERAGRSRADAEAAALVRLGGTDDLARAMLERREFQSWCVRAPWATFGLAPLSFLIGAYFLACLILWSGWRIFLPGTNTPFVPLHGFAIVYFGVGRMLYIMAPFLIGWGIALLAARQRFKAIWPAAGLVLVALLGGMAQVHTSRPTVPGGFGLVSLDFVLGPSVHGVPSALMNAAVIFTAAVLPYLISFLPRSNRTLGQLGKVWHGRGQSRDVAKLGDRRARGAK